MNIKQFFQRIGVYIKSAWTKGKIQRASRITYDVVWNALLFFIIVGVIVGVFAGGVGAGYFASLVKDEPIRDYEEMKNDIYNYEETSKLYFADSKYIGDVRSDIHREEINLDEVSDTLIDAVIATEDEMFYEHNGIVPKAIVRAVYQEFTNSETKTGGSTLTQQLIKNQILTNEVSFERKAKEILLAMRLEHFFEKDEIMEAYLNIIPYGREASGKNIAGIQTASKGVFGVEPEELTLPQAAYLAGMPKNPFAYTPFTKDGEIKEDEGLEPGIKRMQVVLNRMYRAEFITEEEFNDAMEYDIVGDFTEKSISPIEKNPAIVFELEKRASKILMKQIAEEDELTMEELNKDDELKEKYEELADRALRMNGYNIHSTVDKKMYDTMRKVGDDYESYGPEKTFVPKGQEEEKTEKVEAGAVLIENNSGKILSFYPGRSNSINNQNNFATSTKRDPGSTIKPLAVYAPAMDLGVTQPGSVIADVPGLPGYQPGNYGGAYYGLVSTREALASSYNVTAAEVYKKIVGENPAKNYLEKMGFPKLNEEQQQNPSLALGTMGQGITVEQNTNAFATFSNGGDYVPSYMIEKITDSKGNTIYEHESKPTEVFSKETAYLMTDMMRDVLSSGTAASLPSRLSHGGVDWAGKTGTTDDYWDAWFVGTNPNVTLGTWIGYETPSSIYCANCSLSYSQRNQHLWANFVNALSDIDPELVSPKDSHKRPDGIVSRSYCATSGMAPSDLCSKAGLVRSDIYNANFTPGKTDDSLTGGNMPLVKVDGKEVIADKNTPSEFTSGGKGGGFTFSSEFLKRNGYDRLGDLSVLIPRKHAEAWSKISVKGGSSSSASAIDGDRDKNPPAPGSLSASKTNISWGAATGHLIVGYRIYQANDKGSSGKLIGHTTGTSYSLPNKEGVYYVQAVNYYGKESGPSKKVTVKEKDKKDDDDKNEEEEEKEKEEEEKEIEEDKKEEEKEKDEEKQQEKEEEKEKEDEEKQDKEEEKED